VSEGRLCAVVLLLRPWPWTYDLETGLKSSQDVSPHRKWSSQATEKLQLKWVQKQIQQIGFLSHSDPYAVISLEAVAYSSYCNTVEWFWWDWSLSHWPTGFLQCFDTVGWVIWPVKIVHEMIYKVSSGTLSLYSLPHFSTFSIFKAG